MKTVLAKNNLNKLVLLPRNFCLKNLIDINYNNSFLVLNADVIKLATRVLKIAPLQILANHEELDFLLKTKHYTGAIIYSNFIIAQAFLDLLDKFLETLFKDKGFIYLLKDK
jgi:hypothetical protein